MVSSAQEASEDLAMLQDQDHVNEKRVHPTDTDETLGVKVPRTSVVLTSAMVESSMQKASEEMAMLQDQDPVIEKRVHPTNPEEAFTKDEWIQFGIDSLNDAAQGLRLWEQAISVDLISSSKKVHPLDDSGRGWSFLEFHSFTNMNLEKT